MHPKRLVLRDSALQDIMRHERRLAAVRGDAFATAWTDALLRWLTTLADLGAQYGTAHPKHQGYRTFGYRRQATILAEFSRETMDVVRIRFAGEDWQE